MDTLNKESDSMDGKNDVAMTECHEETHSESKDKKGSDDNEKLCPLFMDGLPSDFSTNPGLAAIASLFDEESEDSVAPKKKEYETPSTRVGGGKLRRTPARSKRKNDGRPYQNRQRKSDTKATSVGETHLFLKMWKL
jgi:hypothetical protein